MPTVTPFRWLHLTDFHYGLSGQNFLWPNLREAFLRDLEDLHKIAGPWDAIFFTGDLAQQGLKSEFEGMEKDVLSVLFDKLKELGSGSAKLYCVPGNHDLQRPRTDQGCAAVDTLFDPNGFERCKVAFWKDSTNDYRKVINECFKEYLSWWQNSTYVTPPTKYGEIPGDYSCTHTHGDLKIGIIGLNTTFLQLAKGDYKGRLEWNVQQLTRSCDEPIDVWVKRHQACILLTHQGPDWLTSQAREHGATEIAPAGRFAIHMFGHMHEPKITRTHTGGALIGTNEILGRSAFGLEFFGSKEPLKRSHGYSSGELVFSPSGDIVFRLWPRVASCSTGPWRYVSDEQNYHLLEDRATAPCNAGKFNAVSNQIKSPIESRLPSSVESFDRRTMSNEAVLFTIYRPEYKQWYCQRQIDSEIENLPFEKPIWIWGASGCGKTALAHYFALKRFERLIFVDLSTSVGLNLKSTLENFYWTLVDALEVSDEYKSLTGIETSIDFLRVIERLLLDSCRSGTLILIDEFSCKEEESVMEFAKLISNLLVKLTNAPSRMSFQIVVGSVASPLKYNAFSSSKFLEHVSVVRLEKWTDDEMEGWLLMASSTLTWLKEVTIRTDLKMFSQGCPRMLKRICGLHLRHIQKAGWSLAQTIKIHEDELRY